MKLVIKKFYHTLNRFKTSAVLNIAGLSVAFTVFFIIAIQSYSDATYNRNFTKADNLEYITIYYEADERESAFISVPIGQTIAEAIPEIKSYTLVQRWGSQAFNRDIEDGSQSINVEQCVVTDGFLDVFTPEILAGDTREMFSGKDMAIISQSDAIKLFGNENPIGKSIYYHFSKKPITLVAVYKDFPKNCSLPNGIYVANQTINPSEWSFKIYAEIQSGSHDIVKEKLNSDERIAALFSAYTSKQVGKKGVEFRSISVKEAYMIQGNNKTTFISLIAIGVVILIIAYINFLNFSIAMAPSRVKSVNIHKILGMNRSSLQMIMIFEGVFLAFISLGFSLFFIYFFSLSPLSSFFSASLLISENLALIGIVSLFLIILIAIVGIYPAKYATSFPEAVALSSSFALSPRGVYMRNVLILIQFVAAISLCCIAYFIKIQHEYMINYSSGIEKENVVYLPLRGLDTDLNSFGDEMIKNSLVLDYTASEAVPGSVPMGWGKVLEDKQVQFTSWPVTPNFLDFFGVKIIAGDGFTDTKKDSTALEQIIFNNKFIEKYGFDNKIIGKNFYCFRDGIIKGISGDINFQSLHYPIEPMAFVVLNGSYGEARLNYVFFKISGQDIPATIEYMNKTWSKFSKDEFKLTFLDQTMNDLYKKEDNMASLIGFFSLITIVIAIMGIYGLIVFNTRYKTKEIAVRKVNGATELKIILMLNKGLLILFLIAFTISVPLAYYAIERWVEDFPYKASIPWWLFLGAAIVVFIISAITVSWQSWKAATANPVKSLKNE